MFLFLVLATAAATVAGFIATREAFRSGASPEALLALLAGGVVCLALLGSASAFAIPAAAGAAIGLALGLNVERRRRATRPALAIVRGSEVGARADRRAA